MKTINFNIVSLIPIVMLVASVTACSPSEQKVEQTDSKTDVEQTDQSSTNTAPEKSAQTTATTPYEIDFSQEMSTISLEGLSGKEKFGRWTDGKTASIALDQDLPSNFTLAINGYAFGPNTGKDVSVTVGSQQQTFSLGSQPEEVKLEFQGVSDSTQKITFDIPSPASPKELGKSADERKLGIAFVKMTITPQ